MMRASIIVGGVECVFALMCENMDGRRDVAMGLNFDPDAGEPTSKDPHDGTTASERLKGLLKTELQWIKRHGRTRLMSSSIGEGDPARFPSDGLVFVNHPPLFYLLSNFKVFLKSRFTSSMALRIASAQSNQ